jgi:uncharacterized protein with ACT and thioredoxin-like domain
MNYTFIEINDTKYVIRKTFSLDMVKDINILTELKWMFGADTVIKSEQHNKVFLVNKIDDAIILELFED